MDVISLKDPNEGIPMPLMHDMLFEGSFRQSVYPQDLQPNI